MGHKRGHNSYSGASLIDIQSYVSNCWLTGEGGNPFSWGQCPCDPVYAPVWQAYNIIFAHIIRILEYVLEGMWFVRRLGLESCQSDTINMPHPCGSIPLKWQCT